MVPREPLASRVGPLPVERVVERRLLRLVVGGDWPVGQAGRHEQPTPAVGLHDERLVAPDGVIGPRVVGRLVIGGLARCEVRDVVAGPLPLLLVPPDVLLALAPGPALVVGGGSVVDDVAVHRPRPTPFEGYPVLLAPGLAPVGLIDLVFVDAAVDPAPAGGRAVVLEHGVAGQGVVVLIPAVDLAQYALAVGLVVRALGGVVPSEVENGAVLGVL